MNNRMISYLGKKISVGIDVHRKFFVVAVVCEGELVKRCRMPAHGKYVVGFIRKYFSEAEVETCYEAGFSGFVLHRHLTEVGIHNIVVNASSIEVAQRDRVKTDKRDAKKLAIQLDSGRLEGIRVPALEQEAARLLPRTREQLVRAKTRVRNQIRMKLHQFGYIDPDERRQLSRKLVSGILEQDLPAELRLSIELLVGVWEALEAQQKALLKELKKQAASDPLEDTWRSLPGIGILSSRVLANELGNMSHFPNQRCLYSFTGLTPSERSTGENIRRGHISRQGSSRLRHILVEAAWKAIKKDPVLKESFDRIAGRQGKKRAIVAIARRLVGRARAVFREKGIYELNHKAAA